jgi:hypothetical protein
MNDETTVPEHLRQLPESEVARLCLFIRSEFPGSSMPFTLRLELDGFERDRTVWDAKRVANALRHCYGRTGLAQEIEDVIAPRSGIFAQLNRGERAP